MGLQDWSDEQVRKHYKWELQGLLGNLLARITSAKHLSLLAASEEEEKGFVWGEEKVEVEDETLDTMLRSLPRRVEDCFQKFEIGRALDGIVDCLKEVRILTLHLHLTLNLFILTLPGKRALHIPQTVAPHHPSPDASTSEFLFVRNAEDLWDIVAGFYTW
jgi:hypothetical protein